MPTQTLNFDGIMKLDEPVNPWARISEIAARVGVPPRKDGDTPSLVARGADGKEYDVWSVVAAVLDRIEVSAVKPREEE